MTARGNHQLIISDVRAGLAELRARMFQMCCTSPPYYGLRDYQAAGQIGAEETPEKYIATLVDVFREVRRVLRPDGTLWLNLGDSYADDSKWGGRTGGIRRKNTHGQTGIGRQKHATGYKPGDLLNIPHRVAAALQADGWYWRSTIHWTKKNPMRESVAGWRWVRCKRKISPPLPTASHRRDDPSTAVLRRQTTVKAEWIDCPGCPKCAAHDGYRLRRARWRPTTAVEYVFLLTPGKHYFCDGDAVRELAATGDPTNRHYRANGKPTGRRKPIAVPPGGSPHSGIHIRASLTRNPLNIWNLSSERYTGAHFATFPSELPQRAILAGTSAAGCCAACGLPWVPVVETDRIPTRPGTDTKVGRVSAQADSPYEIHSGAIVGNRDPHRHVTATHTVGHRPACDCHAAAVPCHVLDPFAGSGTTLQSAVWLGRDATGFELNPDYGIQAEARIATPPRFARRQHATRPRPTLPVDRQLELFGKDSPCAE